jgi:hypothetical protein
LFLASYLPLPDAPPPAARIFESDFNILEQKVPDDYLSKKVPVLGAAHSLMAPCRPALMRGPESFYLKRYG